MKALVYTSPNEMIFRDEPPPAPAIAAGRDLDQGRAAAAKIVLRP